MSLPSTSTDRISDREASWAVAPFKRSDVERPAGAIYGGSVGLGGFPRDWVDFEGKEIGEKSREEIEVKHFIK